MMPTGSSDDSDRRRPGWRMCIAGTGGQGALTAARLLCEYFVQRGHHVVSGQLHGMAQRGGSVQSSVLIDCGISPVIASGRCDVVVGFEPVETARALPLMSADTVVFMNTRPVIPYVVGQQAVLEQDAAGYPNVDDLVDSIRAVTAHLVTCDATGAAGEAGSTKALNMVMLGCLLGAGLLPAAADDFWKAVSKTVPPRLAAVNTTAFWSGVEMVKQSQLVEPKP